MLSCAAIVSQLAWATSAVLVLLGRHGRMSSTWLLRRTADAVGTLSLRLSARTMPLRASVMYVLARRHPA